MRVLIYGECDEYGSGAWCYLQTLKQMGVETDWLHPYSGLEQYMQNIAWKVIRKLNRRDPLPHHLKKHNRLLLERVRSFRPDLVIILKGLFVDVPTIEQMKQAGSWVVNINHDDFFSHNPNNRSRVQFAAIPYYHHIFTTREVNVSELKPFNKNTSFFPFAFSPEIHRLPELNEEAHKKWKSDVLFVGTWERDRARLMEELVQKVPAQYAIYGSQWDKVASHSPLRPFLKFKELRGDDMAHAIRYAKMALGFLRKENRDEYTQRSFEIPACGGLLLAERTPKHLEFYKDGVEAVFFNANDIGDLSQKLSFLLDHQEERERIRKAGHAKVSTAGHTYADRLTHLFKHYEQRGQ